MPQEMWLWFVVLYFSLPMLFKVNSLALDGPSTSEITVSNTGKRSLWSYQQSPSRLWTFIHVYLLETALSGTNHITQPANLSLMHCWPVTPYGKKDLSERFIDSLCPIQTWSTSQELCTPCFVRFWCSLIPTDLIYTYSSGLLPWHWAATRLPQYWCNIPEEYN